MGILSRMNLMLVGCSRFAFASAKDPVVDDQDEQVLLQQNIHSATKRTSLLGHHEDTAVVPVRAGCLRSEELAAEFCRDATAHFATCKLAYSGNLWVKSGPRTGLPGFNQPHFDPDFAQDFMWLSEPFRLWCLSYAEKTICPEANSVIEGQYQHNNDLSGTNWADPLGAMSITQNTNGGEYVLYDGINRITGVQEGEDIIWSGAYSGIKTFPIQDSPGWIRFISVTKTVENREAERRLGDWKLDNYKGYTPCDELRNFCTNLAVQFTQDALTRYVNCDEFVSSHTEWNHMCLPRPSEDVSCPTTDDESNEWVHGRWCCDDNHGAHRARVEKKLKDPEGERPSNGCSIAVDEPWRCQYKEVRRFCPESCGLCTVGLNSIDPIEEPVDTVGPIVELPIEEPPIEEPPQACDDAINNNYGIINANHGDILQEKDSRNGKGCRTACRRKNGCLSWTWHRKTTTCTLFKSTPLQTENKKMKSGIVCREEARVFRSRLLERAARGGPPNAEPVGCSLLVETVAMSKDDSGYGR